MPAVPETSPTAPPTTGEYAPSRLELIKTARSRGRLGMMMDVWRNHGDLTRLRIGKRPFFLVVHPEHVRHISVTHRQNYDKLQSYDEVRKLLLGGGVLTATAEPWRQQRKLMAPFFTPRGAEKFLPIFISDTQHFIERWRARQGSGQPVEMLTEMMLITARVILHSVFSTDSDETLLRFKGAVETMIAFVSDRNNLPFRTPLWLPTPGNLRFKRAQRLVNAYIRQLLAQRRAIPESQWPEDLLTKLMTTRDEETGATMADQLLLDNGITLFFAGHETTARTLSFLWYALSQNPEVEARLHAELDSVLGDAPPTLDDLKKLPYTLRVVKEVLRLYPAAPFYARDSIAEDSLDGVTIPAGSRMLLFSFATHRHPAFWEDPERFDPDRWLPEREAARDSHAYHPFAAGQRICLGNNFSLFETHLITAMLARRFKVRLEPGHTPHIDTAGTLGVRNGLWMRIEAR
ncbi:cytochrome P450 [Archangium lipolyticum]|uniref:cytochrome P450 n=1 Tax=Archangium lipolyticum TaxID=2970465 RepID=UPI00214A57B5|nr:cytochrome P450 [Archangium lipolyticum]